MREIVKKWIEYCETDVESNIGEYDMLFMDNATEKEVEAIFTSFVNREQLSYRMNRYLKDYRDGGLNNTIHDDKKEYMENLLKLDFEERKPYVKYMNLSEKVFFPTKYEFKSNFKEVEEYVMGDVFSQCFGDFFDSRQINEEDKTYDLYEAISSISIHYSYTQYLFQPLVNINYTANHIYEFLMRGGTYAVIEDTIYYSFKD